MDEEIRLWSWKAKLGIAIPVVICFAFFASMILCPRTSMGMKAFSLFSIVCWGSIYTLCWWDERKKYKAMPKAKVKKGQ